MRRWRGVVVGALVGAAACGGGGAARTAPTTGASPERPHLAVDVVTQPFVDGSRGTDASGSAPASSRRDLPTKVFLPASGEPARPYPLIVFVHGSGGLGTGYDALFETWASAGYVVAAPALPGSTDQEARRDWTADLPNFPADVRFVVDEMLRVNAAGPGPLQGAVDPARIGIAGHSMGGMITLAVAGNTCCHDPRVKAAVVLAGRETPWGGGQFWAHIRTPVLLVHGDADGNVSYADGRRAYADAPPPRFLLTVLGGDHSGPYTARADDPQAKLVVDATLDFFDQYLKGTDGGVARLEADVADRTLAKLEQER